MMSRCFISFSSRDGEFAGRLMGSLKLQNVPVWDYSDPGHDIRLGESVRLQLHAQIDDSSHFIAVLTPDSTHPESGKYTRFEMQYAFQTGRRIFPVVLGNFSPENAGPGLEFLADLKYIAFPGCEGDSYENAFARLCEEMQVTYVPPFLGDPRIIFAPRFDREIRGLRLPNEYRISLRVLIDKFTREYVAGNWANAKRKLQHFLFEFEEAMPGVPLYYPTLLLALCEMHENQLAKARDIVKTVLNHPNADENAWGALGQIHFLKREFELALENFEIARTKCPAGEDWTARFNILAVYLELGRIQGASAAFDGYDLQSRPIDDQVKVANLQAAVYFRANQWKDVLATLWPIHERRIGNAASAIYLAQAYEHVGDVESSVLVLQTEAARLDDCMLFHHLARLHLKMDQLEPALAIYQHLMKSSERTLQMIVDYALILQWLGRRPECEEICREALRIESLKTATERYLRGFAQYLLGRHEEAKGLYLDSGSQEPYYDIAVRGIHVDARHEMLRVGAAQAQAINWTAYGPDMRPWEPTQANAKDRTSQYQRSHGDSSTCALNGPVASS